MDMNTFNTGPRIKTAKVISTYKSREEGLKDGMIII